MTVTDYMNDPNWKYWWSLTKYHDGSFGVSSIGVIIGMGHTAEEACKMALLEGDKNPDAVWVQYPHHPCSD